MRRLLTVTAVIEAGAGLALVARPSAIIPLLLGPSPQGSAALTVARIAGAALLSLGIACWRARHDSQSPAGSGLISGMLLYNASVVVLLLPSGMSPKTAALALWPAIALHLVMAAWCAASLRKPPAGG